jgi:hypothetical protein
MTNDQRQRTILRLLQPKAQPAWVRIAVGVAFVVVVALSVVRVSRSLHDPAVSAEAPTGLIDFHHVVYFPAVAFRDGVNPYSADYAQKYPVNRQYPPYSPGMFVLHYPFALMTLSMGNVVYYSISLALVVALAASALAVCRVPVGLTNVLGLSTLVLVSRPGHINLLLGQFTLPIVLGAIWALQLARTRPWLAGLALAVTTLKPTFGVPMVWLMFCRRDFRTTFAGVAFGGVLAVAGLAPLIANHGLEPVINSLRESESLHVADPVVDPETTWTRIDAQSLVGKLLTDKPPAWAELAVTATSLLAAGAAVWFTSRDRGAEGGDGLSALIICTATLACIYHSTYDALLLVVPWVAAAVGRLRGQLPARLRPAVWILLTIPAVNYLSARSVTEALGITGPLWTAITALNSICVTAVLLMAISFAVGPRQTSSI